MTYELEDQAGRTDAPTLLVTKLHPPLVPAQAITRSRLFDRLRGAEQTRLTLVACPAGFGKSTLLAAWRAHELPQRPVAWVSIDEGDNDATVLWLHVVEALARVCSTLDGEHLAGSFASAPLLEVALPQLVNALADQPPVALVLDDLHRLTRDSTRASVAWFVERLPQAVQLVVASRTDPVLPLGTLRARGQLLELRADDLRFTSDEAREFLNERLALGLNEADIELLASRTEGWPAGLYLAALSLAGRPDKAHRVRAFDGTSAHIVDFLTAEVLATFEPRLQAFMLRTSVLERLCAPLCDAVLDEPGASASLEALVPANLFLIPLDDHRRWYRFHHLFAQLLRQELDRRDPRAAAELHRRAFAWHRAFGTTGEAIHHAVAAGEFADAGTLICETWNEHANVGRVRSVLEWLDAFPAEVLAADAELLLVRAWASAMVGKREEQLRYVTQVLALPHAPAGPLRDGFGSVEASVVLLRATFPWGDVSAILENGRRSEQVEPAASPFRPVATWALGWGYYCNGELDEAERWLRETTCIAPPAEQWIVGLAAMGDLSLIAGLRGDADEQLRLATAAMELMHERGMSEAVEIGEVHTAYGAALAAHGRLAEARDHLEHGVFVRRIWAQQLDLVDALVGLAPVAAALDDAAGARRLLAEADDLLARCADPGVLPRRVDAARAVVEARAEAHGASARLVVPRSSMRTDPAPPATAEPLSERELGVLRLLRTGLSEREIGHELFISFNTVHSHVKAIYRKLGVTSRAAAVARADDRGLL